MITIGLQLLPTIRRLLHGVAVKLAVSRKVARLEHIGSRVDVIEQTPQPFSNGAEFLDVVAFGKRSAEQGGRVNRLPRHWWGCVVFHIRSFLVIRRESATHL